MPNGTVTIDFDLPGGGAVNAWSTSVQISHPWPAWQLDLPADAVDEDRLGTARSATIDAADRFAQHLSAMLGGPDVGPVLVTAETTPAPLKVSYPGTVAGWTRTNGTIQLAFTQHGLMFPGEGASPDSPATDRNAGTPRRRRDDRQTGPLGRRDGRCPAATPGSRRRRPAGDRRTDSGRQGRPELSEVRRVGLARGAFDAVRARWTDRSVSSTRRRTRDGRGFRTSGPPR